MATTKDKDGGKKLSLKSGKLELKKTIERDVVKQSFSHGRSKTVQVEVRKKRTYKPGEAPAGDTAKAEDAALEESLKGRPRRRPRARPMRPLLKGRSRV